MSGRRRRRYWVQRWLVLFKGCSEFCSLTCLTAYQREVSQKTDSLQLLWALAVLLMKAITLSAFSFSILFILSKTSKETRIYLSMNEIAGV